MSHPGTRKRAVAAAFGAAAMGYEAAATAQRRVAAGLAERIMALDLPRQPRVLEIGCGTGFLGRALLGRLTPACWIFSDLAEAMVRRCRSNVAGAPTARFLVMDGELPCLASGSFDLICSSLACQWFEHLPESLAGLARLLAPGGHLAVATLGAESFAAWRAAQAQLGLPADLPDYPSAPELQTLWPAGGTGAVAEQHLDLPCGNGRSFLRQLQRIGAGVPASERPPLTAGTLRRALRSLEAPDGLALSYHVLYGLFRRSP